jgi:hypothetical protein
MYCLPSKAKSPKLVGRWWLRAFGHMTNFHIILLKGQSYHQKKHVIRVRPSPSLVITIFLIMLYGQHLKFERSTQGANNV